MRPTLSRATGLVTGLVVGLALAACGNSRDPAPRVIPAADGLTASGGSTVTMTIPSGVLSFSVGDPVPEIDQEETDDGHGYDAPDGSELVPVVWQQDSLAPDFGLGLDEGEQFPAADLSVTASGETTTFGTFDLSAGSHQGAAWVTVPDDGDWTLDATFAGETQSVDPATGERAAGAAAAYYDDSAPSAGPCPAQSAKPATGLRYRVTCTVDAMAVVPYLAEQGWAGSDAAWLVVDTTTTPDPPTYAVGKAEQSRYDVTPDAAASTVDGAEPAAVLADESTATGGQSQSHAFLVPLGDAPHALSLTRRYDLARASGGDPAPARTTLEVTFDVTID